MTVDFGDLPVNLRQEILNLLRDRNISGPEITITGLAASSPLVHDSDRTPLDVVRDLHRSIPDTGGCGGVVAIPELPDRSLTQDLDEIDQTLADFELDRGHGFGD